MSLSLVIEILEKFSTTRLFGLVPRLLNFLEIFQQHVYLDHSLLGTLDTRFGTTEDTEIVNGSFHFMQSSKKSILAFNSDFVIINIMPVNFHGVAERKFFTKISSYFFFQITQRSAAIFRNENFLDFIWIRRNFTEVEKYLERDPLLFLPNSTFCFRFRTFSLPPVKVSYILNFEKILLVSSYLVSTKKPTKFFKGFLPKRSVNLESMFFTQNKQ